MIVVDETYAEPAIKIANGPLTCADAGRGMPAGGFCITLDVSVVVAVLLSAPGDLSGRLATEEVHAPHLLDAKVLQALRRHARQAEVGPELAIAAVDALGIVSITRHAHAPLRHRVWELRSNMAAYDALYVALAERLGIPLVTADARIAGCPGIRTNVEVVPAA